MNLNDLQNTIKIKFKNLDLLRNVFIHRSFLNENKNFPLPSNERLEFLGDSVLSLITSVFLYKNFPELKEGEYTEIKSAIVKTESLAKASEKLNLGHYLYLSKGEEKEGGRKNKNILADCFEALIGAIFLEHNFETAYNFVCEFLFENKIKEIIENKQYHSNKSLLQELIQAKFKKIPEYKLIDSFGPDHKKIFKVAVFVNGKKIAQANGLSKKQAEEKAAGMALKKIEKLI